MEIKEWLKIKDGELVIRKNYFHHHAYEIIQSNNHIKEFFFKTLNKKIKIIPRAKLSKGGKIQAKGINANDLNIQIRKLLKNTNSEIELKLEVLEEHGVFYFSSEKSAIGGFDFAILNNEANLISLRNLCFGQLSYSDADRRWENFMKKNPDLKEMGEKILKVANRGTNIQIQKSEKKEPLIVGEIQFGNWALAYRDFFKVLKADVQNNIDCLIYIVPCGNLERYLSDGIVTYDKTVKIIEDFSKVINVPVWLIGIDIE